MMALLLLFILGLSLIDAHAATNSFDFSLDPKKVVREIKYPFYGFTLDYWKDKGSGGKWYPNASVLVLDFQNPDLIALTKEISPAILRIGGSPQDSVVYNISGECSQNYSLPGYKCSQTSNKYGCINKTRWDEINQFALDTGVQLLYGLNACYGRKSAQASMNLSNAQNLVQYTNSLGDKASVFGFELGNEIDSHIDVDKYTQDFYDLYKIMNGKYKMLGTDNTGSGSYIEQFIAGLNNVDKDLKASDILYRLTYHHYPNCGYPGNDTVFALGCLDSSKKAAASCYNTANPNNITCVMGEGSEHSGGGTPNVSNTFVDNFYYLYQLGNVLTAGDGGTIRSDLTGGDYELIDHMTVKPNPDYWLLYIWKQLIGDALYESSVSPSSGHVRGFAYRSKASSDGIILTLINFDTKNSAHINIAVNDTSNEYNSQVWFLKPDGTQLNSRLIYVNDVLMEYKSGTFPTLQSVTGDAKNINLDPARIAFVLLTPQ